VFEVVVGGWAFVNSECVELKKQSFERDVYFAQQVVGVGD
jgi:hypothetical protein